MLPTILMHDGLLHRRVREGTGLADGQALEINQTVGVSGPLQSR